MMSWAVGASQIPSRHSTMAYAAPIKLNGVSENHFLLDEINC